MRDFSRLAGLLEIADKEFQEIRQRISKYELDVSKKLQNDGQEEEVSLDAISLQVLLDTDEAFIALNKAIEERTGIKIGSSENANYQTILNEFQWLGITTIGGAKRLLEEKKDLAVSLAGENLSREKNKSLLKTIGLFYLCYAILVEEYPEQRWIDYLRDNHLGDVDEADEFVEKLSKIYRKISDRRKKQSSRV